VKVSSLWNEVLPTLFLKKNILHSIGNLFMQVNLPNYVYLWVESNWKAKKRLILSPRILNCIFLEVFRKVERNWKKSEHQRRCRQKYFKAKTMFRKISMTKNRIFHINDRYIILLTMFKDVLLYKARFWRTIHNIFRKKLFFSSGPNT
jgi:hypothetical protein